MLLARLGSAVVVPMVTVLVNAVPAVPDQVRVTTRSEPLASAPSWHAAITWKPGGAGAISQVPALEPTAWLLLVVFKYIERLRLLAASAPALWIVTVSIVEPLVEVPLNFCVIDKSADAAADAEPPDTTCVARLKPATSTATRLPPSSRCRRPNRPVRCASSFAGTVIASNRVEKLTGPTPGDATTKPAGMAASTLH